MLEKGFAWDELDLAPETPGIYSWYMDPILRQADLVDYQSTKDNLLRLADQLKLPSFEVDAKGHLSLSFKGDLDHIHLASEDSMGLSNLVEEVLSDYSKRNIFSIILGAAAPHLMSPLYIGVAIDVRQRLRQHKKDIENYRFRYKSGFKEDIDNDARHKFAFEVVRRGIPSNRLRVFVSSNYEIQDDDVDIRTSAEAVETVLNRLFYPIMGRR